MLRAVFLSLVASTGLLGCGAISREFGEELSCSSQSGHEATFLVINDQVENRIIINSQDTFGQVPSEGKMLAAIDQVKLSLQDIRTSKAESSSTKRFCLAKIKVVFPLEMIASAEKARILRGLNDISDYAENADMQRQANAFTADIAFNVQPTDDGEKVYAEVDDPNAIARLIDAVVGWHLAANKVRELHRQSEQQENVYLTAPSAQPEPYAQTEPSAQPEPHAQSEPSAQTELPAQ